MLNRIIKIFIIALGIFISILFVIKYLQDITRVIYYEREASTINSRLTYNDDSLRVFTGIDSTDFTARPIPDSGDVILTIDNLAATPENWRHLVDSVFTIGYQFPISYLNADGDTLQTSMRRSPVQRKEVIGLAVLVVILIITGSAYILVGFWAFARRPDSGAVRALTLFCLSMATLLATSVSLGERAAFSIPFIDEILGVLRSFGLVFGPLWLTLQLLFPKPRRIIQKRPVLIYGLIFAAPIIPYLFIGPLGDRLTGSIIAVIIAVQILLGFYILTVSYIKTKNPVEKRQSRIVLWGSGIGMGGLLLMIVFFNLLFRWFAGISNFMRIAIIDSMFLLLLISPLSFAYSIGRYRLLEIEGKIRRGTRYAIVTILLFGIFFVFLYFASNLLMNAIGIENRSVVLALAMVLAIGFTTSQGRLKGYVERQIYPERNRLKNMLGNFLQQSLREADHRNFFEGLNSKLKESLGVDKAWTVLNVNQVLHWGEGINAPFTMDSHLIKEIERMGNRPLLLDELLACGRIDITDRERHWLKENEIALILPLNTASRFIGFVAMGFKSDDKDFEPADMEILQSLSSQAAVASENLILVEENLDKQRLEDQLRMAQEVQQGLLPQTMPETPGLDVFGVSYSCLEVAGDYYDVVRLDDTRTMMAVGDVSGKGAGAAMLMSNVQASIRTAIRMGTSLELSQIIAQVNDLICASTRPGEFITFFICVYNAETRRLAYVNAGHNPPLVLRKDGSLTELEEGGLILGAIPDVPYEQGEIELNEGELLFMYTDGLTEAENGSGEMFEEERVRELIRSSIDSGSAQIIDDMWKEVSAFIADTARTDDLTMLAARGIAYNSGQ
jgi:serine phosphatase RsbU (regulator of sigma subunit)